MGSLHWLIQPVDPGGKGGLQNCGARQVVQQATHIKVRLTPDKLY